MSEYQITDCIFAFIFYLTNQRLRLKPTMKKLFILTFILFFPLLAFTQEESSADTLRKDALNVYMEASDYLKERITFINYVRDVKVADLVIITTSDRTGSGGREYTLFLEGQGKYKGMIDTLVYHTSPDETDDQRREKQVQTLKLGLVRYIIKTPLAEFLKVEFTETISSEVSTDKWNSWVFRTNIRGFTRGESLSSDLNVSGGISIGKVTEKWKFDFDIDYDYGKEIYEIDDEVSEYFSRSKSSDFLLVRSINNHWSVGGTAEAMTSTFGSYDFKLNLMPGIEYNIFPYSESTRRQLRFLYSIGYMYNDYIELTQYDKMKESLFAHSLSTSYEIVQKWGSIDISIEWSNYLKDFSLNRLSLDGSIEWRIVKGLNFEAGGRFSFIQDQINLPKSELSPEEILVGNREVATNFRYFTHFGFSYTFGSIYNNVVNPRFGRGGGRRYFF